ncbi:hypothetical protein ACJMK2_008907 [Sinanodonta woodiana]|uniref:Piezo-type mechanosensitive ion channel component n=1 Tax=Sinanodonta woodiana TaxID=1069815 RepID=A0ABD3VDL9_SINWO
MTVRSKVARLVSYLLFRLLLPLVLLTAAVVRYNALSFLYAMLLLMCPLHRVPDAKSIRGSTGLYLCIVFVFGLLGILAHVAFHIILTAFKNPYEAMFSNCTTYERIAREIAVERFEGVPFAHVVRLLFPDVAVFITGLFAYILCRLSHPKGSVEKSLEEATIKPKKTRSKRVIQVFDFIGELTTVLLLAVSGIITPSVFSIFYFLSFLYIATLWSFYGKLGGKFSNFRYVVLVYSALHLLLLHLYQFEFIQRMLPPDDFLPKLLGLTGIIKTDCTTPWLIMFHDVSKWPHFVNPAVLLLLFWAMAFEMRASKEQEKLKPDELDDSMTTTEARKKRQRMKSSERQHLMEAEVKIYSSIERLRETEDRSGSPSMLPGDEETDDDVDKKAPKKKKEVQRSLLISMFVFIMKQSYVLTLIAMMAWSITFHSWLTFVLLLAACGIWMMPRSRRVCLLLSPFILFYGEGLLIIQFVYGMDIKELPEKIGSVDLGEIGLKKFTYPVLQLAVQVLYTSMFWMGCRQFMRERRAWILADEEKYQLQPLSNTESNISWPVVFSRYIWYTLGKYWIVVCAGMLLLIALQEVVVYRIIYMFFFLFFVLSFQLSYTFWRLMMFIFWWVVIVYSMTILIILYTYQFKDFPNYWKHTTGLSTETLADLGLQNFDTAGLFVRLLTPTSFLIIIILQVHYFHKPFLQMSSLDRYSGNDPLADLTETFNADEVRRGTITYFVGGIRFKKKKSWRFMFARRLKKVWLAMSDIWADVSSCLWRLAEVHIFKVVAFIIMMVSVFDVSAIGAVYMIMIAVFLPFTGCGALLTHFAQLWTALILMAKMIFQLKLVDTSYWLSNCTNTENSTDQLPDYFDNTIDSAVWVGLEKTNNIAYYFRNYLGILLILFLERVIIYHQVQFYNRPGETKPMDRIIFPHIKREDADRGTKRCIKYLVNYIFFRFGLEVCYIMTAITICVRVDVIAVIYAIFLGILLCLSRRANAIIWPFYIIILVILLIIQYLSSLGMPLALCADYPWDAELFDTGKEKFQSLVKWFYLPNFQEPPAASKLIADFFQLLFVTLQWRVFWIEPTHPPDDSNPSDKYDGGDNLDIVNEVEAKSKIPVKDFTKEIKSYLDVLKNFIFVYMFWVTLAIVFIAGTTRTNLFSMGYVIAVFFFMWYGQEFLILPYRVMLRKWNFLIGYCFIVLLLKACLQLPTCVYMQEMINNSACWLIQLLGLTCINPANPHLTVTNCTIEKDNMGLAWDVTCFTFLLLQRRIYMSHYFRYVVADLGAQSRLASRGAECINRILIRNVRSRREAEGKLLEKIKQRMKELKEKQQLLKKDYIEPEEHYQAIRSGDYYLFEDSEEEDIEDGKDVDAITFGQSDEDKENKRDNLGDPVSLITTAIQSGTDQAIKRSESKDVEARSEEKLSDDQEPLDRPAPLIPLSDSSSDSFMGERYQKFKTFVTFICCLIRSCAVWFINLCNDTSANYRIVAFQMKDDFEKEKKKIQSEQLVYSQQTVELQSPLHRSPIEEEEDIGTDGPGQEEDGDMVRITVESVDSSFPRVESFRSLDVNLERFQESEKKWEKDKSVMYRLLVAIYYLLVARSELICYFLMILNHLLSASLLSLPLPMFVFMWGMLSVPRSTRTFWSTVITYTEAIVVVKYLFQFSFFPWNANTLVEDSPFWPPRIIGIEKVSNFAAMDLVLLLALFIHRSILKRYGLWRDAEDITAEMEEAEKKEYSVPSTPQSPESARASQQDTVDLSSPTRASQQDIVDLNSPTLATQQDNVDLNSPTLATQQDTVGLDSPTLATQQDTVDLKSPSVQSQQDTVDLNSPTQTSITQMEVDSVSQQSEDREKARKILEQNAKTSRLFKRFAYPVIKFYKQLTSPDYNATTDVYASMFACDFINFLIVVFGYWAFGPEQTAGGNVTSYIQDNRVPIPFLLMLVLQFVLIIVDRALYLRKNVLGKFIFQIFLVIVIHIWVFFALPAITSRKFTENTPAQLWYFVKCVYFGLSAYQIRCGYPTRILGNFLTKKYNYLNLILFKGFLAIPFLLELRSLMDWIWTDTTMAIGSWLQMEDIYANVYVLKCWRTSEVNYPTPRGNPRSLLVKYGVGGLLLVLIIFIIWFPLVIFSFANTVFIANPPIECRVSISIAGYQPLFIVSAQEYDITRYTQTDLDNLKKNYKDNRDALAFLSGFGAEDITRVHLEGKSTSVWGISPPSEHDLIHKLNDSNPDMKLDFYVSFTRAPKSGQAGETLSNDFVRLLNITDQKHLAKIIQNVSISNGTISVDQVFPYYIHLPAKGRAEPATYLRGNKETLLLTLNQSPNVTVSVPGMSKWWTIGTNNSKVLELITFNDRVEPAGFSVITGYGIIGLYISLVLVIGRFVRLFFSGGSFTIMFTELPFVDNILKLCLTIYMVRESGDFYLEEELFSKLLFLYRSPRTMIKWTKYKMIRKLKLD